MRKQYDATMPNEQKRTSRNEGIDLLRNISMFMVVLLHVLGVGGLLAETSGQIVKHEAAKALQIAAMCAVNCYGLISGYVGYGSKFRIASYVTLWLQVFLYSAGLGVVFYLFMPNQVAVKDIMKLCLPVLTERYWYFTAYTALFFTMPLLNASMEHIARRQFEISFGCLLVLLTVCQQTIIVNNPFGTNSGYSYIWLVVLYCVGAYVKKYNVSLNAGKYIYLLCVAICWAAQFVMTKFQMLAPDRLSAYNSPVVFVMGLALLLWFADMKVSKWLGKLVKVLAPASFGVYLIHLHPLVRNYLLLDAFRGLAERPIWLLIPMALLSTVAIFGVCAMVDLLRHTLFRVLDIKGRLTKLENKLLHEDGGKR